MKIHMDDIIKIERPSKYYGKTFKISWKMTNWCNYSCEYCYMKSAVQKAKIYFNMQEEQKRLENIAERIDKLIELNCSHKNKIKLHLIGGEICWFNLEQILSKITSKKFNEVMFATNFSNSIQYWTSLCTYLKNRAITTDIIASFHLTCCNRDEFIKKVLEMSKISKMHVKCVTNEENLRTYQDYFNTLKANNIPIQITVERNSMNSCKNALNSNESETMVSRLNEYYGNSKKHSYYTVTLNDGSIYNFYSNIELINSIDIGGLDTENFLCTAGLDGIRITPDGTLQRAGCRYCASKFGAGKIGNILDDDVWSKFPITEPILCHSSLPDELVDENGKKTGLPNYSKMIKKYCTCFINANMYRNNGDKDND